MSIHFCHKIFFEKKSTHKALLGDTEKKLFAAFRPIFPKPVTYIIHTSAVVSEETGVKPKKLCFYLKKGTSGCLKGIHTIHPYILYTLLYVYIYYIIVVCLSTNGELGDIKCYYF